MQKILVPTDFSDCANDAASMAIMIAKKANASIQFFHSTSVPADWASMSTHTLGDANLTVKEKEARYPEVKAQIGEAKQNLHDLVKRAQGEGVEATSTLAYNLAYKDIINHATSFSADLIVMGTHGASGVKELFVGSNTQKVVRSAKCPVLTVRDYKGQVDFKDIVFVSDFEEKEVKNKFEAVLKFAEIFDAQIHLLYVNTPTQFEDSQYSRFKMEDLG